MEGDIFLSLLMTLIPLLPRLCQGRGLSGNKDTTYLHIYLPIYLPTNTYQRLDWETRLSGGMCEGKFGGTRRLDRLAGVAALLCPWS